MELAPPALASSLRVDEGLVTRELRKFDHGLGTEGLEPQLFYGDWTNLTYGEVNAASAAKVGLANAQIDPIYERHPMVVASYTDVPGAVMERFHRGPSGGYDASTGSVLVLFDAASGKYLGTQSG